MKSRILAILLLILFTPLVHANKTPGLQIGQKAPDFEALNYENKTIKLSSFYQQGPVILVFYRGGWCPYCNTQLQELQNHLNDIKKYNATLIAISVDKPLKGAETVEELDLQFEVISDNQIEILKSYRLINLLSENSIRKYKSKHGIDIEEYSGHFDHIVAIPATFVIDQSGTITFAYANEDYKARATPSQILEALDQMAKGPKVKVRKKNLEEKPKDLPVKVTEEVVAPTNDKPIEAKVDDVPVKASEKESDESIDAQNVETPVKNLPEGKTDEKELEVLDEQPEMMDEEILNDNDAEAINNDEELSFLDAEILFTPINHASMVIESDPLTIYVDPAGEKAIFEKFKKPDIILITDIHSDHLDSDLVNELKTQTTSIVGPKEVIEKLDFGDILNNEENGNFKDINIEAIAMYNLTEDRLKYHEKGRGNGYIITLNNKRIYISGDTEDIAEMRALKNIDYAFICMNDPYTMTVEQAVSAVLEFSPKIVIPYHYRGTDGNSDVNLFKTLVSKESDIIVKLLKWY